MKSIPEDFNLDDATCMLKFAADWCGPCKTVTPVLENVVDQTGVEIFEVNIDELPELASKFGVRSIPAVIGFKNGEPVNMVVGAHQEGTYKALADEVLG